MFNKDTYDELLQHTGDFWQAFFSPRVGLTGSGFDIIVTNTA
jgi:hypothetical protein